MSVDPPPRVDHSALLGHHRRGLSARDALHVRFSLRERPPDADLDVPRAVSVLSVDLDSESLVVPLDQQRAGSYAGDAVSGRARSPLAIHNEGRIDRAAAPATKVGTAETQPARLNASDTNKLALTRVDLPDTNVDQCLPEMVAVTVPEVPLVDVHAPAILSSVWTIVKLTPIVNERSP